MSVDQINKKICLPLTALCCWLLSCSPGEPFKSARGKRAGGSHPPSPFAPHSAARELAFEPPVPLKALSRETSSELRPLASLSSVDRAGHRRLQLYLSQPAPPSQAQYWQLIARYRTQYDVIWIYTTSGRSPDTSSWLARAAWFRPELSKSFHYPGFKPQYQHDGLYWTHAP